MPTASCISGLRNRKLHFKPDINILKLLLSLTCIFLFSCSKKQKTITAFAERLVYDVNHAKDDITKVQSLGQLAIYYMEIDPAKSDSVMQDAYEIAENSKVAQQEPLIICYLADAERQLVLSDYETNLDKVHDLAGKARKLSGDNNLLDYVAYSYLYDAQASRYSGRFREAQGYCKKATELSSTSKSDSLQLETLSTSSQVAEELRLMNDALRNASQAYIIAEKTQNKHLKLQAYRRLAYVYENIDSAASIENYKKYIELATDLNDKEELIWAYLGLSRHYATKPEFYFQASKYLHNALQLSKEINHATLTNQVEFDLIGYYINSGKPDSAYAYLKTCENAIAGYYAKNNLTGRLYFRYAKINYNLGQYYRNKNITGSADACFKAVLNHCDSAKRRYHEDATPDRKSYLFFYNGAANYFLYYLHKKELNSWNESTTGLSDDLTRYYSNADYSFGEAQDLFAGLENPQDMSNILKWREDLAVDSAGFYYQVFTHKLYSTRQAQADYSARAWAVRKLYDSCDKAFSFYNDSKERAVVLDQLAKNKVQIENERQQHLDNIKIAGIVFALVLVFILLITGGYLRVSMAVTRGLNFFAFIFLFEFILLLTEKQVHEWTHGELVSSLLIKIALAAFLVPLHHFLEEKVIHTIRERALSKNL